ncbi:hypothetical protein AB0I76_15555, partial [Micromonospora sp. NPDC049799]
MVDQQVPAEPGDRRSAPVDPSPGVAGSRPDLVRPHQPAAAPARARATVATAVAPPEDGVDPSPARSGSTTYRATGSAEPMPPVPAQRGATPPVGVSDSPAVPSSEPPAGPARASFTVPGTSRVSAAEAAAIRSHTGEARIYRAGPVNPEPPEPAQPPEPAKPPTPPTPEPEPAPAPI